ncbi:MAG TPA: hypothetical protein VFF12_15385 [Myxococcaceae bacterium]|nr:hypothetical protein [Myxococcaceae bacterium]
MTSGTKVRILTAAVRSVLLVSAVALVPSRALAQGTPLPLPAEPGGARPPIYTQPTQPLPPVRSEPVPLAPAPTSPSASPSVPGGAGGAPEQAETKEGKDTPAGKVPQVTSFPELTQGTGNAERLLEE